MRPSNNKERHRASLKKKRYKKVLRHRGLARSIFLVCFFNETVDHWNRTGQHIQLKSLVIFSLSPSFLYSLFIFLLSLFSFYNIFDTDTVIIFLWNDLQEREREEEKEEGRVEKRFLFFLFSYSFFFYISFEACCVFFNAALFVMLFVFVMES